MNKLSLSSGSPHRRLRHCTVEDCADGFPPGTLHDKEYASKDDAKKETNNKIKAEQFRVSTLSTKRYSRTYMVIPMVMTQMVIYSILFTRFRVSHTASVARSIPSTKMSAPTTMTAMQTVSVTVKSRTITYAGSQ
jgi:heme/copper-type cytochrome/quinol oxidase subunit 3